jgi:UDP-N-acetylmuramyl pentapeptide phosphotransferase/UDP-N-acetylglucosamine-1-phosphate transferase
MIPWACGVFCAASFILAAALCVVVRDAALKRKLVDLPNERSLHVAPVPRVGGVALTMSAFAVFVAGGMVLRTFERPDLRACLIGSFVIAALGSVDDIHPLPASLRLLVQASTAAAVLRVAHFGSRIGLAAHLSLSLPPYIGVAIGTLFVVGTTNIYNFMDGMDGLAGSQAISTGMTMACAAAVCGNSDVSAVFVPIAGAAAGFLLHNFPPADLFLGDAGSTFLGFAFGSVGLVAAGRETPVPFDVTLLALAPFLLDGSTTIVRRAVLGQPVWRAHRTHLYQRAVATKLTHRDVLHVYAVWMVACALAAVVVTRATAWVAVVAATLTAGVGLVAVWTWVIRREAAVSQESLVTKPANLISDRVA